MLCNSLFAALGLAITMAAAPPADRDITLTSGSVTRELTLPELSGPRDRYALRVAGISVPPGSPALFRVFVDLPTADRSTPSTSPHYVGRASILAGPPSAPKNVIMTLNWPREHNLGPGAKLRFTLVPVLDVSDNPIRIQKLEITTTHP